MSKLHFRRSREALFEAALIVFAVLVALGVDKIMEQREELQLAQAALEHVATEIRHNRDELLQARESNQALLNDLGFRIRKRPLPPPKKKSGAVTP